MKVKTRYVCSQCSATFSQWAGQCIQCGVWNCLHEETAVSPGPGARGAGYANARSLIMSMDEIPESHETRMDCGLSELNRVLGGGLVEGSVVLIGGDPGIGESTLLLQTVASLSAQKKASEPGKVSAPQKVLYVTGEESLQQVAMRARRLQLPAEGLRFLAETQIEAIIAHAQRELPRVMVIDSIQTVFTEALSSAPGLVGRCVNPQLNWFVLQK